MASLLRWSNRIRYAHFKHLGKANDCIRRSAQFVAHIRKKGGFGLTSLFGRFPCGDQFCFLPLFVRKCR